jgi:hypothetical protein
MVTDRAENVPYRRTELRSEEGARRRAIYAYFGLTFLISWGIEFLLIASENRWGGIALPPSAHYLAAYGPMAAAIVVTAWTAGGAGLKELWGRITLWRVGWGWFLISLLSPAALSSSARPSPGSWTEAARVVLAGAGQLHAHARHSDRLGVLVSHLWDGRGDRLARLCPSPPAARRQRRPRHAHSWTRVGAVAPAALLLPGYLSEDGIVDVPVLGLHHCLWERGLHLDL